MRLTEEITDEEKLAIDEVRHEYASLVLQLRNRMKSEIEQDTYDDIYLFRRFLAAREFNIDKAEDMLRKYLEWWKKYDVKNISNFEEPEVIEKYLVYVLVGFDKENCPVRYCPVGNIDYIGIVSSFKFEDLVKVMIYVLESDTTLLKEQSEKCKKNIDKCIYIADVKNLSFAQATDKKSVNAFILLLNFYINYYPERLKAMYVINESYKNDILKHVDAEELPAFLGGNQTDPDGNPLCLTKIKQAGERVPEKYFVNRSKRTLSKLPGVQKVTLSRAAFHEVNMDVKEPGSYLEWEFETKCRDIGFGLFLNEMADGEEKITELVPIQRIDTEEYPETGTIKCEHAGTYVIVFDNTYSWVRAKEIYYRVKIVSPEEHEAELKAK